MCSQIFSFILPFSFCSIQTNLAYRSCLLTSSSPIDSIILIDPGNAYYIKSTAALQIAKHLSGGYRLLSNFLFLPESFRNLVYDFIAKNRYKWFGKKDLKNIHQLINRDSLERFARENYGHKKEDETIFYVEIEDSLKLR